MPLADDPLPAIRQDAFGLLRDEGVGFGAERGAIA